MTTCQLVAYLFLIKLTPLNTINRTEARARQSLHAIALWSRLNLLTADYGETILRTQYLWIRFEDLCHQPVQGSPRSSPSSVWLVRWSPAPDARAGHRTPSAAGARKSQTPWRRSTGSVMWLLNGS